MTFCPCNPIASDVSGVTLGGSADVDKPNDPYDGIIFVYGLDDAYDGTANEVIDSTSNQLHGTGGGGSAVLTPTPVAGVFCSIAQHFTTGRQYISCPKDTLPANQGFTLSLWVNIETFYQARNWLTRGFKTIGGDKWVFTIGHSVLNHVIASVKGVDDVVYDCYSNVLLDAETWYHVACTFTPGVGITTFVNGVASNSTSVDETLTAEYSNGNYIARFENGGYPLGKLQEVRLYPDVRADEYLLAEYSNFCNEGFYSVGGLVEGATG